MVHDDDDARESVRPEELLAPPGLRRSSYTPPSRDAESLQAAANVFNDDAIAEAMAAEIAKIASGPIPIVPPQYRIPLSRPASAAPPAAPPVDVSAEPPSPPAPPAVDFTAAPPPSGPPVLSVPSVPAPVSAPPPPYLGAPAPTVPPADAPPPPGYEYVARVGGQPPVTASPRAPVSDEPPQPTSLNDDELVRTFDENKAETATIEVIEQLQAQLDLREREARERSEWEASRLAASSPAAAPNAAEFAPAPEPVSPFAPRPDAEREAAGVVPPADEPSLEGTAFADFHFSDFRFAPPTLPTPPRDEEDPAQQVPFPGVATPSESPSAPAAPPVANSPFAPPPLVEPPVPDATYPVFSDQIGVLPTLDEKSSPESISEQRIEPPGEPMPPESTPPADFETLLSGAEHAAEPPRGEWAAPPPNLFTEPTIDAATGAPLPFGVGVARDNAVDPIQGVFGTSLGSASDPERVNSQGVTIVGQLSTPSGSQPFEEIPAPAAAAESIVAAKQVAPARAQLFRAEDSGEEPTQLDQRVGRAARLFWLWFASNSSLVAVVFGGIIFSLGMSLRQTMVATLAGVALSFIPLGLGTLAGKRSGQPTMVISRATFGLVGNVVPAIIGVLSRLFWGAALLWLVGAGSADILSGAKLRGGFTETQLTFILMLIAFVVVLLCAYFGYALIARIQLVVSIVSAVLLIGFVAMTARYVDVSVALRTGDGSWVLVITGAVLVFSFVGLVWANSGSDLARYQRPGSSGSSSMLWATFGAAVPSFLLIAYGALLCASNRGFARGLLSNPLDQLGRLLPAWYPVPLIVVTVLGLLSGAIVTIYSGGFALQATGVRAPRKHNTIAVGVLVLVIALVLTLTISDFTQLFRDFATTLAVPVAAWAGIFAAELMIRNRRFDSRSLLRRGGVYADVRWGNLIALVVIVAIGFGLSAATVGWLSWEGYLFTPFGVALDGQLASSDLGVVVALLLGLLFPIVAGIPAIRRQESATRSAE